VNVDNGRCWLTLDGIAARPIRERPGGGDLDDVVMPGSAAYCSLALERHPGPVAGPDVEPVDVGVVGFFRLHTCACFAGQLKTWI
jgi:hypothetical protein